MVWFTNKEKAQGGYMKGNKTPGAVVTEDIPPEFSHLGKKFPVVNITEVDDRDKNTPDAWVPRHPELVRLTGKHPFNCEPPLPLLMEHGFLSPVSLHYVRNHGAAIKADWDSHRVSVEGVPYPAVMTMDDITSVPPLVRNVTLVCAGNRRKEQNMTAQTIGFSWGPTAHATSIWKGAPIRDVLIKCGVSPHGPYKGHLCMVGPEGELPKGKKGDYGTSVPLWYAMDPANDMMLAYEQNGALLTSDHGFPVRIIIPGYIGGRMIKCVVRLAITEEESDNFYHFNDNRILPPHVTAEIANAEGWWYKPEYIFNELNINSAMCYPAHDEVIPLVRGGTYKMSGYAYCGAGKKITRIEVSFDDGKVWELATLITTEKPTEFGKYWCRCNWEMEIELLKLVRCKEMCLRAWDQCSNTQPATLTWNVMGMGNNPYYRVKVHPVRTAGNTPAFKFEHPTQPGNVPGGWMVPTQAAPAPAPAKKPEAAAGGVKKFTMEEVEKHNTKEDAWIVVAGKVYDSTKFLKDHPGGAESILINVGTDTTEEFEAIHSKKAWKMLDDYEIGEVGSADDKGGSSSDKIAVPSVPVTPTTEASGPKVALDPKQKIAFKMVEKEALSHDTRRFRFELQSPEHVLGLPVGKHMLLSARIDGNLVMRAYTPISSNDDVGFFDLVIKVYFANVEPRFPEGGKLTQYLESLSIGDSVDVKGPLGRFEYTGRGHYTVEGEVGFAKRFSLLAGGSGITPVMQVMTAALNDPEDTTELSLIYANKTEEDILLRKQLDAFAAKFPGRVKVWYTLDKPGDGWKYGSGFVSEDMVREHFFPADGETTALMCGPPPMIKFAGMANLEKVGYAPDRCIAF